MDILKTALKLTTGDRHSEYGDCTVELDRVALAMIALKITRQMHSNKKDNWIDIAGYARIGDIVNKEL
jgi:hypothetical protein